MEEEEEQQQEEQQQQLQEVEEEYNDGNDERQQQMARARETARATAPRAGSKSNSCYSGGKSHNKKSETDVDA
eukprot:jgi/Psemu1/40231/gm1.40231_g